MKWRHSRYDLYVVGHDVYSHYFAKLTVSSCLNKIESVALRKAYC